MQTAKGGVTTTYGYDGNGNLVRESVGGVTTDFVLDERGPLPHILGEVRSDGSETLYAYGTDGLAAQQTIVGDAPQGIEYPLLDALGSLRHLTNASGALTLRSQLRCLRRDQAQQRRGPEPHGLHRRADGRGGRHDLSARAALQPCAWPLPSSATPSAASRRGAISR